MKSKTQLTLLFIIFSYFSYGQEGLYFQDRPNGNNYCIQTTFNLLNNSSIYFDDFLNNEIGISRLGETEDKIDGKAGIGYIKKTYIKSGVYIGKNIDYDAYKVFVQYFVFGIDKGFVVDKLDIWGNWESVANIFIRYYPTTLNINYLRNSKSEISSYYIADKAVFTSEIVNGRLQGRITVRNSQNKDYKEILKKYDIEKQEKIKKEKQEYEKIKVFLNERAKTIYSIKKINKESYKKIASENFEIISNLNDYYINLKLDFKLVLRFDTIGQQTVELIGNNLDLLPYAIMSKLREIKIQAPKINSYFVSSVDTMNFSINFYSELINVVKRDKGIRYKDMYSDHSKKIVSEFIERKNKGKYSLILKNILVNNESKSSIEIKGYKELLSLKQYEYIGILLVTFATYYFVK